MEKHFKQYCRYKFKYTQYRKDLRIGAISSRTSQLFVTDSLFLGIAKENLDKTEKNLINTRNLVEVLKRE